MTNPTEIRLDRVILANAAWIVAAICFDVVIATLLPVELSFLLILLVLSGVAIPLIVQPRSVVIDDEEVTVTTKLGRARVIRRGEAQYHVNCSWGSCRIWADGSFGLAGRQYLVFTYRRGGVAAWCVMPSLLTATGSRRNLSGRSAPRGAPNSCSKTASRVAAARPVGGIVRCPAAAQPQEDMVTNESHGSGTPSSPWLAPRGAPPRGAAGLDSPTDIKTWSAGKVCAVVGVGVLAAFLLIGGCTAALISAGDDSERSVSPPIQAPTTAAAPTTTPPPPPAPTFTVTEVIDGDTVEVNTGERVRLIGIDTPEAGTGDCANTATARLAELALNHSVTLVAGARDDTDRYARLLRYVDTDLDTGHQLIVEGLAIARYDSRDGYGRHTREAEYVATDASSPNCVNTASPARALGPAPPSCCPASQLHRRLAPAATHVLHAAGRGGGAE